MAKCSLSSCCASQAKVSMLELWFFRSYSNTLPTQSMRESCFQLPQSAVRHPWTPVLSAEQWHVTASGEERQD